MIKIDIIFKKFRYIFVTNRLFFSRGYGIVGNIGFAYLVSAQLHNQLAASNIPISTILLMPMSCVLIWLAGVVEYKLGFFSEEQEFIWRSNKHAYSLNKRKKK